MLNSTLCTIIYLIEANIFEEVACLGPRPSSLRGGEKSSVDYIIDVTHLLYDIEIVCKVSFKGDPSCSQHVSALLYKIINV